MTKEVDKVLCIYHGNCNDGYLAAAIVYSIFPLADFHPASYGKPPPSVKGYQFVYIVDFSYDPKTLNQMSIDIGAGNEVVVIDHHQTAWDQLSLDLDSGGNLYEVMFDNERSGAGLTWDYFYQQPRPPLVDFVEDRDLWNFNLEGTKEVAAWMKFQSKDPKKIKEFSTNMYLSAEVLIDKGVEALKIQEALVEMVAANYQYCEMGGRIFPIVNSPYLMGSDVCDYLMAKLKTNMAAYFLFNGSEWQYGFRSNNGVTVNDFAEGYGGGGHAQASGCRSDSILHTKSRGPDPL